jgi:hypothetical protein
MDAQYVASQVPADIAGAYNELGWLIDDLDDMTAEDVKEWRCELRRSLVVWRDRNEEPDWGNFREWINEICRDGGYPSILEA